MAIKGHSPRGLCVNVLDFVVAPLSGVSQTRGEVINEQAGRVISAWQEHILDFLTDEYVVDGLDWADLDTLDGLQGSVSPNAGIQTAGANSTTSFPPNICYLVHKRAGSRRGQRGGRMFLYGVGESFADDSGNIPGGSQAGINGSLNSFLEAVNFEFGNPVTQGENYLCVVNQPAGLPVSAERVTQLVVDGTVSTQRRRMRR
jgi:hypothetical protein